MKTPPLSLACLPLALALASSTALAAQSAYLHPRVSLLWETPAELRNPESALLDQDNEIIFVSNVAGAPTEKDGEGFISLVRADGTIPVIRWIAGLNAPKGMALFKKTLYVADIDQIVEIDLATERIQVRWTVDGAKSLNDVDVTSDGTVFVSDSEDNRIHCIAKGRPEVFLQSDEVANANGLLVYRDELLVAAGGRLVAVNLQTKAVRTFMENTGYVDGIAAYDTKGRLIISDFQGMARMVQVGESPTLLFDTSRVATNAADISYNARRRTLFVPTFSHNTLAAYRLRL